MIGELPTSLEVAGKSYAIRTDYRDVLNIILAFQDPELEATEKLFVCLYVLYKNFDGLKAEQYEEAYNRAVWFLDCGDEPSEKQKSARVMDWEQDAKIIFPAINSVAGFEVRSRKYIHWWTFMGYFMEIHEGTFSEVLSLRQKKAKGKKLEKWEREFWSSNKDLCVLRQKLTEEEKQQKEALEKLLS